MLEDIVIEKKLIITNKFYKINKYICWFLEIRDILLDYMNKEPDRNKIYEFMSFLYLIKYKDIIFITNNSHILIELENGQYKSVLYMIDDNYKILELENDDYKVKFTLDKEYKIEYSVKESNTNYLFDINENNDNTVSNIIYNQVKDNINSILNEKVYDIAKEYFLKTDIIL